MQTFLFVAEVAGPLEQYLQGVSARATPLIPRSPDNVGFHKEFPEIAGGWVTWKSAATPTLLIDEDIRPELAVLTFGELASGELPARAVADAFQKGGSARARELNGTFCAIIIERSERRAHVLTDRVGRLAASCWIQGGRLHVAPHEVLLGVCGCPFELDAVSAASIVGCGWSITGAPLNRNLLRIDGRRTLAWRDSQSNVRDVPLFGPTSRVRASDGGAIRDVVDSMCAAVTQAAGARATKTVEVEAGLTAGLDSRAVLGSLLSGFEPEQIQLYTTGASDSLDVRVATRLAQSLGLRHELRPFETPTDEAFQAHDSVRAFMANGDTNSRASLAPIPLPRAPGTLIAGGGGGEIVRGYYYRNARDAVGEKQVIQRLCSRKFVRLGGLGMSADLVQGVTGRLGQCFGSYSALSSAREDWLDLFYLHERFAHFAAPSARKQDAARWLPFADTELLELAWRLPAPLAAHCDLHRQLIRRFLPRHVYWTPLNGKHPPALEGSGRTKKLLREVAFVLGHARQKLSRRKKSRAAGPTAEGLFATAIHPYVRDLLSAEGSIARAVLGPARLEHVLQEHRSRQKQIEALGPLVNMEHFRHLYLRAFEARLRE